MILAYWRRTTGHVEAVYEYHIAKIGHSLLIAAVASAVVRPTLTLVLAAVMGYLIIGKILVRSRPSLDWIADTLIGLYAVPAFLALTGAREDALVWALVLSVVYFVLVLRLRWASP